MPHSELSSNQTRGSILPIALITLTVMMMMGAAGFEAAWFAMHAANGQLAAATAFHIAETGLQTYAAGNGTSVGSFRLEASWGEAHVLIQPLIRLPDSSRLVRVVSLGTAPTASLPIGRRHLEELFLVSPSGARIRTSGSWTEKM